MKQKPRVRLRNLFTLLGLIGLCIVVLMNRHQFRDFWHLFGTIRWYVMLVILLVQLGSYWVNALYYSSILKVFSHDVGITRLFKGALATNFVNYIAPTVGLAGAGYLSQVLSPEVPRGESVLTQLMRYALSALAVLIMLPVGFLIILLSNDSGRTIVKVTLIAAFGITLLAVCIVLLIRQERLLRRLINWLIQKLKHIYPKFSGENALKHFINEFYIGYHTLTNKKRQMLLPFSWSMVYIIIEIATFYMAFLAFGKLENIGVVIMAYLFANIASIFGGVLFSVGTFELGMTGTLVALGVPFDLAFSVTVVYRIFNLLIGLPPGFYYYRNYLPG